MYKVSFYKQVVKYYTRLDSKTQKRINIAVDEIMKNPFTGVHIKKLKESYGVKSLHYTLGYIGI